MSFKICFWVALKNCDIAISETRITKQVSLLSNLDMNNYSFQFTATETSSVGILLYSANLISNVKKASICRSGILNSNFYLNLLICTNSTWVVKKPIRWRILASENRDW